MAMGRSGTHHGSSDVRNLARLMLTALGVILVLGVVAVLAAATLIATRRVMSAAMRRPTCGPETLVGQLGTVREPLAPLGQVLVDGALWRARETWPEAGAPVVAGGDRVVVERVDGLTLLVRRAETWEVEA